MQYVAGGFYANDRTDENNGRSFPTAPAPIPSTAITGQPFNSVRVPTNQRTLTKAVFGNLDFKFNDWLSAHAGARHTWSSINFRGCMQDVDGLWAPGANSILARINPSAPVSGRVPASRFCPT
jgi:iron complex outermembrane receptor protein